MKNINSEDMQHANKNMGMYSECDDAITNKVGDVLKH